MNTCYIACALECNIEIKKDVTDLIIAADKGYLTLVENGISPDVVIGDFDSYTDEINCETIIKFPVKKDDTDSALAIKYAIQKGYNKVVVYGAIGGMLDHTLSNVSLCAKYAKEGIFVSFIDGDNILFAIHNSKISFSKEAKGRISVFSFDQISHGVNERGLLYNLENASLSSSIPLGVSNEFIGERAEISVSDGTLLIYTSKINFENCLTKE